MDIQIEWINKYINEIVLEDNLQPYLKYVCHLWNKSIEVSGNRYSYFAVYALRPMLERIALIWTKLDPSINTNQIIEDFKSNNLQVRKLAAQTIMDFAEATDKDFQLLYAMLSQYFGHVSNLDLIRINKEVPKARLLEIRSKILPLLLIIDTGLCLTNLITELLKDLDKIPDNLTAGRKNQYTVKNYIRIASYVMCEKHTRKKGIPFRTLISGIIDIPGEIGITDIYRGGMEVFRYGNPDEKPSIKSISECSLFAVGHVDSKDIHVKVIKEGSKGEKYQITWPKRYEIDAVAISSIATSKINHEESFPSFDYIAEFIKAVESLEEMKKTKE